MPRKSDILTINNEKLDRRVKLSQENKKLIKELYETTKYSYNDLAKTFNVSKRTIQFIANPTKLIENVKRRKERGGSSQYYDRDKQKNYMKKHRDYKKHLFINNLI